MSILIYHLRKAVIAIVTILLHSMAIMAELFGPLPVFTLEALQINNIGTYCGSRIV